MSYSYLRDSGRRQNDAFIRLLLAVRSFSEVEDYLLGEQSDQASFSQYFSFHFLLNSLLIHLFQVLKSQHIRKRV